MAIATFNFSRGVPPASQNKYSLSFILPAPQLPYFFIFNPLVQVRVPLIIRRFRAVARKVSCPPLVVPRAAPWSTHRRGAPITHTQKTALERLSIAVIDLVNSFGDANTTLAPVDIRVRAWTMAPPGPRAGGGGRGCIVP